jgi:hypothetical protein
MRGLDPLLSGLGGADWTETGGFPHVTLESGRSRHESQLGDIRLFVGGRVKPGHDGKI